MNHPRTLVLLALAGIAGLAVFVFQMGVIISMANLAFGAQSFSASVSTVIDQISDGEVDTAAARVETMNASAQRIDSAANAWHVAALGNIPGANVAVLNWQRLGEAAQGVSDGTSELLSMYGDLSGSSGDTRIFSNGAIDIAQLRELIPRTERIDQDITKMSTALRAIRTDGPLAGLLKRVQDSAIRQVEPAERAVKVLRDVTPLLPDALGADGVRRYLVAIGNQAEMRAAGGAPLSLVLVEFDEGRISIPIKGTTSTQLFPPVNRPVQWFGPARNPFFPGNPRDAPFVSANTHPNLLYSAQEMVAAWEGGDFPRVDGLVTIDLTAIGAVLNATGPIDSAVYGPVDGVRIGQILLIDAYEIFGQEEADFRQQANEDLLDALLVRILSGGDLIRATQALASTAPGRHFQVWMREPALERLALVSGAGGDVSDPNVGDWSAIYSQNGNQSKVDVFQQRNVFVNAQLAADGSARVTQQLIVTNATPPERPAEGTFGRVGYETTWLRAAYILYVPDKARNFNAVYPQDFIIRPFRGHKQLGRGWVDDGFGHRMIRLIGWTPPGGQASMSISYDLPAGTFSTNNPDVLRYNLQAEPQSLWNAPLLTVQVSGPPGWQPVDQEGMSGQDGVAQISAVQDRPVNVSVSLRNEAP